MGGVVLWSKFREFLDGKHCGCGTIKGSPALRSTWYLLQSGLLEVGLCWRMVYIILLQVFHFLSKCNLASVRSIAIRCSLAFRHLILYS